MNEAEGYRIERDGAVATLVFNRPEVGNAISGEMVDGLTAFFTDAQRGDDIRCIVVRGEGRHFSTGGDLAGYARLIEEDVSALPAVFAEKLEMTSALVQAILAFDRPIVAAVRGAAAGAGLMFALAADLVLVDETALFLFSHQVIGLSPDGGVSWLLPRVVGARAASRLVLTAAKVGTHEALALGLATRLVPAADLETECCILGRRFAQAPQMAVRAAKALLASSGALSAKDQLDAERAAIIHCVSGDDFIKGVRAFLEKRPPDFSR